MVNLIKTSGLCAVFVICHCIAIPVLQNTQAPTSDINSTRPLNGSSDIDITNETALSSESDENSTNGQAGMTDHLIGQRPGLLEYEDKMLVETLEEVEDDNEGESVGVPPDVYEVSFLEWLRDSLEPQIPNPSARLGARRPQNSIRSIIRDTLRESAPQRRHHRARHHNSLRPTNMAANRMMSDEPVVNLPVENLSQDLLSMLQSTTEERDTTASPLSVLSERDRFNMTVDYQAPFHNIEKQKLLEIILLMNSDCTLLPSRIVRWVSGKRGILFDCKNGVWVVKYLMRRRNKPRPVNIRDCHEVHLTGSLGDTYTKHQAVIEYSDDERKSYDVLCKHELSHTDHDLIDNHISTDPDEPQRQRRETAGAWTVIQRRENGSTKFYRSFKKYKRGFGKLEQGEYWLGLEALHQITHLRRYMLRVEITTGDNNTYFSEYDHIRVASEAKQYRLKLGNFIPPTEEESDCSAGDFMSLHNRGEFQTRDAEEYPVNCAKLYGTAFWFRGCWTAVNLNGPYIADDEQNAGVRWATANPDEIRRVWKTEMLIKPVL